MLTKEKLMQLMTDLEPETVERTRIYDKAEKKGQAITAFANDILKEMMKDHRNAQVEHRGSRKNGGWFRRT